MIGIKGAGMAALAQVLVKRGKRVTGSDTSEVFFTDAILKGIGIAPLEGFSPEHIPHDVECIIYSTSYAPERNEELKAALESDRPVLSYPEAIGSLTHEYLTLAVAGTHGKTTTTSMIAALLDAGGVDPTVINGGIINAYGKK